VRLVDLSHTVEHGMITYKGLPAPVICDFLSREASKAHYAEGTSFQIGKIEMVANTGTYLDSPFHRYADGKDLAELPLTSLANLPGVSFVRRQMPEKSRTICLRAATSLERRSSSTLAGRNTGARINTSKVTRS
jgi:arylformamidase